MPFGFACRAESRFKNPQRFDRRLESRSRKLTYSSSSDGHLTQMGVELISVVAKSNLLTSV